MTFNLENLFIDVFAPQQGDVATILYDFPHGPILDTPEWQERRNMAQEWHQQLPEFASKYGVDVRPFVTYQATGAHARDLPEFGLQDGKQVRLEDIAQASTILISMPQFSATAPLAAFTRKHENLRVASMPLITRAMQETGLSANYRKVAETCARLAPLFNKAEGVEVLFSTGHNCYFDFSDGKPAVQDNGQLHPGATPRIGNLPAGEVYIVPNESPDSKTMGEIPVHYGQETVVFVIENNEVVDVCGDSPIAISKRQEFREEKAMRNVAEVAIGCNDKAIVTGNPLEDEKAGFHWAYGRSEFLGGTVSPQDFSTPNKVIHMDIVYAMGNPIVCHQLDFIFPDRTRQTVIREGLLSLEDKS